MKITDHVAQTMKSLVLALNIIYINMIFNSVIRGEALAFRLLSNN
jgi:hypothetical protein